MLKSCYLIVWILLASNMASGSLIESNRTTGAIFMDILSEKIHSLLGQRSRWVEASVSDKENWIQEITRLSLNPECIQSLAAFVTDLSTLKPHSVASKRLI